MNSAKLSLKTLKNCIDSHQDLIKVCYTTREQICDFIFKPTGESSSLDWIHQWIGIIFV